MHRLRRLSRGGRLLLALAVGGALFGIATAVQADIPDSGVIHGCYSKYNLQNLRVIDASKGQNCLGNEIPLNWNQTGPTGGRGATGPTGPSDGWIGVVDGDIPPGGTLTALSGGTDPLDVGKYLINGQIGSDLNSSTNELECFLELQSGTGFVPDNFSFLTVGPGDDSSTPLTGWASVSAGAVVGVSCRSNAGTGTVGVLGWINLTRVGTLHT
jgi:hypothetical protein